MKLSSIFATIFFLFVASPATGTDNGMIGLYFDPDGQNCTATIEPDSFATIYVQAVLAGTTSGGIHGAEFRIVGKPAGWYFLPQPEVDGVIIGDPLGAGVTMGFSSCQTGTNGRVTLYTISVFATSSVSNQFLSVVAKDPPTNPDQQAVILVQCDSTLTGERAPITQSVINPAPEASCGVIAMNTPTTTPVPGSLEPGPVFPPGGLHAVPAAVKEMTWSALKSVYKN